jgi:orotate phosphoribosyltransferase
VLSPALLLGAPANEVAKKLVAVGAYGFADFDDESTYFLWKSGRRAPVYLDCRVAAGDPGCRSVIGRGLARAIRRHFPGIDCVVGLSDSGIGWSAMAADAVGLPAHFVRKEPKAHGRGRMLEPAARPGSTAVLVDDLVASGGSALAAVDHLEAAGVRTVGMLSVVNWDFLEMRRRFGERSIAVRALTSFPQLLRAALAAGRVDARLARRLEAFYLDPERWGWSQEGDVARHRLVERVA